MFQNILLTTGVYLFWHFTQIFLEHDNDDNVNNDKIVDRLHNSIILSKLHNYLLNNMYITKLLIIVTTLMIDINMIYFFLEFIINNKIKPIVLLIGGVILRQLCQYINRLPMPKDVLWLDPGFPTLIMNYKVANDFFFSGHTLVSLIFGVELFLSNNIYVKMYSIFYMMMEILFVLASRSHYFMDVYGAVSTYFMMSYIYDNFMVYLL